jgi:hypothetical protein
VIFLSRVIAASVYAGAAFWFGMMLGERGELGFVQHVFKFVVPIATVVLTIVSRNARTHVAFTGLALLAGLLLGQQRFARAWEDCSMRAHTVRTALLAHHTQHGGYPSRLEELPIEIPCGTTFRDTILHYLSNERGFRLWYTNDRERKVATDRQPFR